MGATDEQQEQQDGRAVFTAADIAALGHTVRTEWVSIPEWGGKEVCVWGTTRADIARIAQDIRVGGDDLDKCETRRVIATVIECCRESDAKDAERIFTRKDHWAWIEQQPTSVLDRIINAVQELDMSSGIRMEQMLDFFAMTQALRNCLQRIGSVSGACTDCPENSRWSCPLQALALQSPPTASAPSEKTDMSATPAAESSAEAKPA